MGIRDWFKRNKQENELNLRAVEGSWNFRSGNTGITINGLTDTGVEYPDLYDNNVQMKLYTFNMIKNNLATRGEVEQLGKMYETFAFEAPASWDIEEAIQNGLLTTLLTQTNAIRGTFNNGRQIDVLGRFDQNSIFTYSDYGIQDYVDTQYVPRLNEHIERQRAVEEQKRIKENDPGFLIKAMGKVLDFFDGIKEKRLAKKEMKALPAGNEERLNTELSRKEKGLSDNVIKTAGKDSFYIGNPDDRNIMAIDIIGEPQMLADGSYLYTAKRQVIGTFNSPANLLRVPNCQFSLPVAPENFKSFLENCENKDNPYAKSNADALMALLNAEKIDGQGLYIGGLWVGRDNNLRYSECQHIQDSIQQLNGTEYRNLGNQERGKDDWVL